MVTVRCPNCEATYQLDPAKLADGGRKLKCAHCQTVWVATLPETEAVPAPVVEVPAEVPAAEAAALVAEVTDAPEVEAGAVAEDVPPPDEMLVQRTPNVEALVHVGGWRQWVRGDNIWRSGAVGFVMLGLLAGIGVGAWNFWPKAAEKPVAPVAAKTETHVETAMVVPPKGVVLHRVRGEVTPLEESGGTGVALTVRGLLANITSETLVAPALRLELLGADGKVADMWPVSGVSGKLEPQSEQAWTVSLTAPDMSSVKGWRVVFVSSADAPAQGSVHKAVAPVEPVDAGSEQE